MNILINATSASLGGGLTVLRNLVAAFLEVDEGRNHYTMVGRTAFRRQLDPGHARVSFLGSETGGRSLLTRLVWEQAALPMLATRCKADVIFSPSNLAVLASPLPQVLMFQNLVPFSFDADQLYPLKNRLRFSALKGLGIISARKADRTIFISDAQRSAILPLLGIQPDRVAMIYLGRDPAFFPGARAGLAALQIRRPVPARYLLCVSAFYRYKNLVQLVQAFAQAVSSLPETVHLVIAGAEAEPIYAAEVREAIAAEGVDRRVILLGALPYEELPALYAGAELFLFPSICESFPNILIEALASGVPVLSSNRCSMPELAGEGARYFDPDSPQKIAGLMVEVLGNNAERDRLRTAGLVRAQRFSWGETAKTLLTILDEARR